MLGTPPAFVLSQDQTLNDWYYYSFRCDNQFRDFALSKYSRIFVGFSLLHDSLTCFLSKVLVSCFSLFNLQGTLRKRGTRLIYHTVVRLSRAFFEAIRFRSFLFVAFRPDSLIIVARPVHLVKNFFSFSYSFQDRQAFASPGFQVLR